MESEPGHRTQDVEGGRGEQVERAGGAILLEVGCEGGTGRKDWREVQDEAASVFCLFAFKTHKMSIGLGTVPEERKTL